MEKYQQQKVPTNVRKTEGYIVFLDLYFVLYITAVYLCINFIF